MALINVTMTNALALAARAVTALESIAVSLHALERLSATDAARPLGPPENVSHSRSCGTTLPVQP